MSHAVHVHSAIQNTQTPLQQFSMRPRRQQRARTMEQGVWSSGEQPGSSLSKDRISGNRWFASGLHVAFVPPPSRVEPTSLCSPHLRAGGGAS